MFTVYVLQSTSTGQQYVGQTNHLKRRLNEHFEGLAGYTKNRGPWRLVHQEQFSTRSEAMRRERYLKTGAGREWLRLELKSRAGPPVVD